jgi:hypothetical protein
MPTKSHVKSFPSGRVGNDRIDAVQRQFGEYPIEFRGERNISSAQESCRSSPHNAKRQISDELPPDSAP